MSAADADSKYFCCCCCRSGSRPRCRFDGVITLVSVLGEVMIALPNAYNDRTAVRFFTLLRMLRVLRIFSKLDSFAVIFGAFFQLRPVFTRLVRPTLCQPKTIRIKRLLINSLNSCA